MQRPSLAAIVRASTRSVSGWLALSAAAIANLVANLVVNPVGGGVNATGWATTHAFSGTGHSDALAPAVQMKVFATAGASTHVVR